MTEQDKEKRLHHRRFYKAEQEAGFVESQDHSTPQTRSPAYKLAFRDNDFMLREELRPVRFQLELLKCEMLLDEANIGSTLVCYGSARIPSPEMAEEALKTATEIVETGRIVARDQLFSMSPLPPTRERPITADASLSEAPGRVGPSAGNSERRAAADSW